MLRLNLSKLFKVRNVKTYKILRGVLHRKLLKIDTEYFYIVFNKDYSFNFYTELKDKNKKYIKIKTKDYKKVFSITHSSLVVIKIDFENNTISLDDRLVYGTTKIELD